MGGASLEDADELVSEWVDGEWWSAGVGGDVSSVDGLAVAADGGSGGECWCWEGGVALWAGSIGLGWRRGLG